MDYKDKIDLHLHSTASDGSFDPLEIIRRAIRLNLKAISLTDHDSVAGVKKILTCGLPPAISFLTGVEISAQPPAWFSGSGSIHLLGYGFSPDDPDLNRSLIQQQHARRNRNPDIISRLNALGIDISLEEVEAAAGKESIGRPHIAAVLVKKGIAASIDEAFDSLLGKKGPAYVEKPRIPAAGAVQMINNAGGIAVLAHPGLIDPTKVEKLLTNLISMGLSGIEAYYSDHTREQTEAFIRLADKHQLLISGGSDFHGDLIPEIRMGTGRGDLFVPYRIYEQMAAALRQR